MKKLIIALMFLLIPALAFGASVPLEWKETPKATGFKVYQSNDLGATWIMVKDAGNVLSTVILNVPDTGTVYFKIGAYNAQMEVIRYDAGAWFNGAWTPLNVPGGVGIP